MDHRTKFSTGRGVVELYQRQSRRQKDYFLTVMVLTLALGFMLGLFVGAMIVSSQESYEVPKKGESFYEQQRYRYQPA